MFTHSILLALAGLAAQSVLGAPTAITSHSNVEARGSESIDHSAVVGFEETAPPTIEGTLMLRYKPTLKVFGGCVPFPAVDANGKIGYVCLILSPKGTCTFCALATVQDSSD